MFCVLICSSTGVDQRARDIFGHNCFPKQYNFQYAQDTHENIVTQTPEYVI